MNPLKPNLTNYSVNLTPYHGERQPLALLERGFSALFLQGLPCLGAITSPAPVSACREAAVYRFVAAEADVEHTFAAGQPG